MTINKKIKWIIGIIVAVVTGIIVPIYISKSNAKKVKVIPKGNIMIEQKIIGPGGGATDGIIIDKSIKIRKETNK